LFTLIKEDREGFASLGYNSILIKFKFYILKKELDQLDKDLIDYGRRIYENLHQFGGCSKNIHLNTAMKETLDYKGTIPKEETIKPNPPQPVKTEPIRQEKPKVEIGGITSFFANAFNMVSQSTQKVELKTEEPKPEEIYYDSVKKRWVLRGKIYDDEDEGLTNEQSSPEKKVVNPPKPIAKPPKVNTYAPPKVNPPSDIIQPKEEIKGNKINNPFETSKSTVKRDTVPKQNKPSLANRYSSIVD
jgi:hypothetical protein